MIRVWHRSRPNFNSDYSEAKKLWEVPGMFVLVAELDRNGNKDVTEEEWAYYRTNSIESPWTGNKDVRAVSDGLRSTSVGDVVETSDGRFMLCVSIGWKELPVKMSSEQQKAVEELHARSRITPK